MIWTTTWRCANGHLHEIGLAAWDDDENNKDDVEDIGRKRLGESISCICLSRAFRAEHKATSYAKLEEAYDDAALVYQEIVKQQLELLPYISSDHLN